jgi:hypothetical protein
VLDQIQNSSIDDIENLGQHAFLKFELQGANLAVEMRLHALLRQNQPIQAYCSPFGQMKERDDCADLSA